MKQCEVKCKVPNCYHSRPMGQGTAKEAARMHEMLGDPHTCTLIPVKS
jgi:hypothetical protein